MSERLLEIPAYPPQPIVPGSTHTLEFVQNAVADWSLYHLKCDVVNEAGTLIASISSTSNEITLANVTINSVVYQQITATFPAVKTELMPELTTLRFDMLATLKSNAAIIIPVLTVSQFDVLERITNA